MYFDFALMALAALFLSLGSAKSEEPREPRRGAPIVTAEVRLPLQPATTRA